MEVVSRKAMVWQDRRTGLWTFAHYCRTVYDRGGPYMAKIEGIYGWRPAYRTALAHMNDHRRGHGEVQTHQQR